MQLIQFQSSPKQSCSVTASAPIVGQAFLDVAVGAGATPVPLFTALASGSVPFAAGQLANNTCADLQVVLTYLDSADCDACTTEAITTVNRTVLVPKGSTFPLPTGLISEATVATGNIIGGVFTASNLQTAGKIIWYSEYQTGCTDSGCLKLVP